MLSPIEKGLLKEARNKYFNIIISDTTTRNILPPQVNKIHNTKACVFMSVSLLPKVFIFNYLYGVNFM